MDRLHSFVCFKSPCPRAVPSGGGVPSLLSSWGPAVYYILLCGDGHPRLGRMSSLKCQSCRPWETQSYWPWKDLWQWPVLRDTASVLPPPPKLVISSNSLEYKQARSHGQHLVTVFIPARPWGRRERGWLFSLCKWGVVGEKWGRDQGSEAACWEALKLTACVTVALVTFPLWASVTWTVMWASAGWFQKSFDRKQSMLRTLVLAHDI